MAPRELLGIAARNLIERDAERVRGDGETPEGIAQLLDETIAIARAVLEDTFPDEAEHFTGFLGQSGGSVEEALVGSEGRVGGAQGGALVFVECHDLGPEAVAPLAIADPRVRFRVC